MNKTKYIEAGRFVERFGNWYTEEGTENGFIGTIKDLVNQMPAANVAEVCRCKHCSKSAEHPNGRWCKLHQTVTQNSDYCSWWNEKMVNEDE